jgi:hypothetical protein
MPNLEVKQAAIAWHSRAADPEYSLFQSKELLTRLEDLLKRRPYKVLRGNRVIEVRHEHVTKGSAVGHLLERHPKADFIFCAGDDRTDEDMMRAFPQSLKNKVVTCWVGAPNAHADYWRESNQGLLGELETMASVWEKNARKATRAVSVKAPNRKRAKKARKKPTQKAVASKATKKPTASKATKKSTASKKTSAKRKSSNGIKSSNGAGGRGVKAAKTTNKVSKATHASKAKSKRAPASSSDA